MTLTPQNTTLYFPVKTDQGETVFLPKCEIERIQLERQFRDKRTAERKDHQARKYLRKNKFGSYSRN